MASPETEGCRDFLGGLEGSGMAFEVALVPTRVQGRRAAVAVAAAITRLQRRDRDVIVVVRGGGSKADLGTFDAEPVARAIATSDTPVWTGIGHTGDQSVADEVANRSFITPTECGQELARLVVEFWRSGMEAGVIAARMAEDEIARDNVVSTATVTARRGEHAPSSTAMPTGSDTVRGILRGVGRGQLDAHAQRLTARCGLLGRAAERGLRTEEEVFLGATRRLAALPGRHLGTEDLRLAQWRRLLGAYDYRRQLERGYSVTRDASGAVVRTAAGLVPGAGLVTLLSDGEVSSTVTSLHVPADEDLGTDLDEGTT